MAAKSVHLTSPLVSPFKILGPPSGEAFEVVAPHERLSRPKQDANLASRSYDPAAG